MLSSKRILIPTDFSENSRVTYSYANQLALSQDAVIDLVHVIQSLSYLEISREVAEHPLDVDKIFGGLKERLNSRLQEEMDRHFDEEVRGEVFINEELKAAKGIVDQANRRDYDWIVIGSRGRGDSIFMRGSVTRHLIRLSPIPVISFKEPIKADINTILVPVDGSLASLKAFLLALDMAMDKAAKIHLYSVIESNYGGVRFAPPAPDMYHSILQSWKERREDNLHKLFESSHTYSYRDGEAEDHLLVENQKGQKVEVALVIENREATARAIADYAEAHADMVVMTTHGRSGLSKFMIGSVAEKVVRHLDIPICTLGPSKKQTH